MTGIMNLSMIQKLQIHLKLQNNVVPTQKKSIDPEQHSDGTPGVGIGMFIV